MDEMKREIKRETRSVRAKIKVAVPPPKPVAQSGEGKGADFTRRTTRYSIQDGEQRNKSMKVHQACRTRATRNAPRKKQNSRRRGEASNQVTASDKAAKDDGFDNYR